jgi:hypothetical protein
MEACACLAAAFKQVTEGMSGLKGAHFEATAQFVVVDTVAFKIECLQD